VSKRKVILLFKNRNDDGSLNISGKNIKQFRKEMKESGNRFVTDIELKAFATLFHISSSELLN